MSKTLSDHLYKSKFSLSLIQKASQIIVKKGKIQFKESTDLITENDKLILKVFEYFGFLQRVLEDIDKVFIFLKLDLKKIKKVHPKLQKDEDYYKYHFENYVFRVISIQDVLGKLGNVLYQTKIDDEKCNAYNFKEALKRNKNKNHSIFTSILEKMNDTKTIRHKKLHKGNAEITNLQGVIFWEDTERITNMKFDKILHKMSEQNISNQIIAIEEETIQILNLIIQFFDNSIDELEKL